MGQPAAKQGDRVTATDTHLVVFPSGDVKPVPLPFSGVLNGGLSGNVRVLGRPAATAGSTADNVPIHAPPPGTGFLSPPANRGTVLTGSSRVRINGRLAARHGDTALTCNDPADLPVGKVVAAGSVFIG
jgi:uncharacterized Zn-binding protein involved in type VI secretion